MKSYGNLELSEGSDFINLTVTSGSTLPTQFPTLGELFYKTGTDVGLYVYTGTVWQNLSVPATTVPISFVHTQSVASNTWVIAHNLNTLNVTYSFKILIDTVLTPVMPNALVITDANTITVTFGASYTGSATIIGSYS